MITDLDYYNILALILTQHDCVEFPNIYIYIYNYSGVNKLKKGETKELVAVVGFYVLNFK